MSITIDQLKELLDEHFGVPFLPDGHVRTAWAKDYKGKRCLSVYIGRRDVQLDEDGKLIAAGTRYVNLDN